MKKSIEVFTLGKKVISENRYVDEFSFTNFRCYSNKLINNGINRRARLIRTWRKIIKTGTCKTSLELHIWCID